MYRFGLSLLNKMDSLTNYFSLMFAWVQVFRHMPEVQVFYTPKSTLFLCQPFKIMLNSGFSGFLIFLTCTHVFGEDDVKAEVGPDKLSSSDDAGNPNAAWRKRAKRCQCQTVKPMDPNTPVKEDFVRFVCISDTHTKLEQFKNLEIPDGDVLIHAGDFTMQGMPDEVDVVNKYLGTLTHKHKVIIAGNHDITFDLDHVKKNGSRKIWSLTTGMELESRLEHFGVNTVHEMLTDCIYLEDSSVEIYGIKIYGSPWTAGRGFWGFQRQRGPALMKKWNQIPADTDILVTHSPPCGIGDNVNVGVAYKLKRMVGGPAANHVGCVDLLDTVQKRVKPKYHIFGHIHEGYGITTDGTTTFINASTCTHTYDPSNPAIVFDVPLPAGYSKTQEANSIKKDICNNVASSENDAHSDEESDSKKSWDIDEDIDDSNEDLSLSDSLKVDGVTGEEDLDCVEFTHTIDETDIESPHSIATNK